MLGAVALGWISPGQSYFIEDGTTPEEEIDLRSYAGGGGSLRDGYGPDMNDDEDVIAILL